MRSNIKIDTPCKIEGCATWYRIPFYLKGSDCSLGYFSHSREDCGIFSKAKHVWRIESQYIESDETFDNLLDAIDCCDKAIGSLKYKHTVYKLFESVQNKTPIPV